MTGYAPYNFIYAYNLAGELTSTTYPSNRIVTTGYDGAGRINSVVGTPQGGSPTTYFSGTAYWPHGALKNFTFGNQMQRSYTFNKQLQVKEITDTSGSGSQLLDLKYYYGGAAALDDASSLNNGSPTKIQESAVRGGLPHTKRGGPCSDAPRETVLSFRVIGEPSGVKPSFRRFAICGDASLCTVYCRSFPVSRRARTGRGTPPSFRAWSWKSWRLKAAPFACFTASRTRSQSRHPVK